MPKLSMSRSISDPRELERAWAQQYAHLAGRFCNILPRPGGVLVEIGCGRGQLTIPLVKRIPHYQIIGVDRFRGPYSGDQTELLSSLHGRAGKIGIKVVVSEYQTWLASQPGSKYDAIVSSEFLPEIDSEGMRGFFGECYRVLRPNGVAIHSFLSAQARNLRQKRLIEADSEPRWTKTPPVEWFSPPGRLVHEYLRNAGFAGVHMLRMKSGLVIQSEAAKSLLANWDVRQSYWKSHRDELEKRGLEIPDWMIVYGAKPAS